MYNPQGDVIGLFDDELNVVVEYTYDSWGNVSITGSRKDNLGKANPFRYRGYYYDEESGMYYLNSRYYHPEIGRFINADSATDSGSDMLEFNIFVYCANNPVNGYDPTGCGFLKNVGKRLWLNAKTTFKLLLAPFKSVEVKIGLGYGLGGGVNVGKDGISVGGTLKNSTTTSWEYSKGIKDDRSTTGYEVGISLGPIYEFSRSSGISHSLNDDNCTCTYGELYGRQHCPANKPFSNSSDSIGVSGALYLGVGGEFSIGLDVGYMIEYGRGVLNEYHKNKKILNYLKNNKNYLFFITIAFIIIGALISKQVIQDNVFLRAIFTFGYCLPVCFYLYISWKEKDKTDKKKTTYGFFCIFSFIIVIGNVVVDLFMTLNGLW